MSVGTQNDRKAW